VLFRSGNDWGAKGQAWTRFLRGALNAK